jgi:hypothetical protein
MKNTLPYRKNLLLIILMCSILNGCSKKQSIINADNVKINGNAAEYFEVLPGNYEMKLLPGKISMPLKLRTIKEFDQYQIGQYTSIDLEIQVLDHDGNPISMGMTKFSPASTGDWAKIKALLTSKVGEVQNVNFEYGSFITQEDELKNVMENTKGIELVKADISNPNSEISEAATLSTSDGNGDKFVGDWIKTGSASQEMSIEKVGSDYLIKGNGSENYATYEDGKLVTQEDGIPIELSYNDVSGHINLSAEGKSTEFKKK